MANWNKELINNAKAIIFALDKGKTIDGKFVTDTFNAIFGSNLKSTTCHTCIVERSKGIKQEYEKFTASLTSTIDTLIEATEGDSDTSPVQVTAEGVKTPQKGSKGAKKGKK